MTLGKPPSLSGDWYSTCRVWKQRGLAARRCFSSQPPYFLLFPLVFHD